MRTPHRVAAELRAGARGILQRVPRGTSPSEFAAELAAASGGAVVVADEPATSGVAVIDRRGLTEASFRDWDARRASLFPDQSATVVLLDVAGAAAVLRAAPQTASWLGGVRMPAEITVRAARTDQEREVGARALSRALQTNPEFATHHRGQRVGVDIATERLFAPRLGASPVDLAAEALDEGIIYLQHLD